MTTKDFDTFHTDTVVLTQLGERLARHRINSGLTQAALTMPLPDDDSPAAKRIFRFPALPRQTYHGLPGLLADAPIGSAHGRHRTAVPAHGVQHRCP